MIVVHARVIDSTHLELAEPISVHHGEPVVVSVSESCDEGSEREEWLALSIEGLGRVYGDDEPDYSSALVKEANPDYRA